MYKWAIVFMLALLVVAMPIALISNDQTPVHPETADQECAECHETEQAVWFNGRHGMVNVKCVICHGSTEQNFMAKPNNIYQCRGCHGNYVEDVEKRVPQEARNCFLCHNPHSLNLKFHRLEGK